MMYQCGRCGLTRASGQEMGVITQCKCPWEFVPPVAPQRTWVGLNDDDKKQIAKAANYNWEMTTGEYAERIGRLTEEKLKELNT